MTEPRTDAGRQAIGRMCHPNGMKDYEPPALDLVLAIEAEAVAAYREQVRAAVEGLLNEFAGVTPDTAAGHEQFGAFHGVEVTRSAVLALLDAPPDAP